ncbi:MAG: triose-phosphate isomerase family protein [Candidatus Paceibacterota bacterium]|jgi:triosephosphate isomerase
MKIIVGNWKMNPKTLGEAKKMLAEINDVARPLTREKVKVVICPPTLFLPSLAGFLYEDNLAIGAQNAASENFAELTGGVSPYALADMGIRYVILGHSDLRRDGESNEEVGKKVFCALANGITPIICFGEKTRDPDGAYKEEIKAQIRAAIRDCVGRPYAKKIIMAYEPVWAIGPTAIREATPDDLREIIALTRETLAENFGRLNAEEIPILYGGSANAKNAHLYLGSGADGLLVGRASRSAENFGAMLQVAETIGE